jgi:hypothetical protein
LRRLSLEINGAKAQKGGNTVDTKVLSLLKAMRLCLDDKSKLIAQNLYVHKDVKDDDVISFAKTAIKFPIKNYAENAIVLMNDNCVCFYQAGNYYLFNAKVD